MTAPQDTPGPGEVTALLRRIGVGDDEALRELLPLVYDTLKQVARRQLRGRAGGTLRTTELVHEAYLKLAPQQPLDWQGRSHFYGVAARAMRQVLVDHARRKSAQKRGAGRAPVTLTDGKGRYELDVDELLALDQAMERLSERSDRLRKVVELRFFAGLPESEIAELLGVSSRTVERDWVKARMLLHRELYPREPDASDEPRP